MNDELKRMWKEVISIFKLISQLLPGDTKETM